MANYKSKFTGAEIDSRLTDVSNKIPKSEKGVSNGVATLDSSGKVPTSQLPSYVDDVLEYSSRSAFPSTGEGGKLYLATDKNEIYRWTGSTYVSISSASTGGLVLGETSGTAYEGSKGKKNADDIITLQDDVANLTTGKQDKLVAGSGITISGNTISATGSSLSLGETSTTAYAGDKGKQNADNIATLQTKVTSLENSKQDKLVSGTNIKTINGTSILGEGNIEISGGGGSTTITFDFNLIYPETPTIETYNYVKTLYMQIKTMNVVAIDQNNGMYITPNDIEIIDVSNFDIYCCLRSLGASFILSRAIYKSSSPFSVPIAATDIPSTAALSCYNAFDFFTETLFAIDIPLTPIKKTFTLKDEFGDEDIEKLIKSGFLPFITVGNSQLSFYINLTFVGDFLGSMTFMGYFFTTQVKVSITLLKSETNSRQWDFEIMNI